jgi:hypothetical protein
MATREGPVRTLGARGMGALVVATMLAWCAQAAAQEPLDETRFLQLQACMDLPDAQRPACVEPLVADLPDTIARGFREQADPAWRAMVERQAQAWEAAFTRHANALAARGGARNLAAAALLLPDPREVPASRPRTDAAAAWYARAMAEGARDPLLAALHVSSCDEFLPDCPPWPARVARAIALAPAEGAHRLMAMGASAAQDDARTMRAQLAAASRAPHLDHGAYALLRFLANAIQGVAPPDFAFSEQERDAYPAFVREWGAHGEGYPVAWVLGRWSALIGYSPNAVLRTCGAGPESLQVDAAVRADCIAVLARIADEKPTMLGSMIALPHLVRLTDGSAQHALWRERLREFAWLRAQAYPVQGVPPMLPLAEHLRHMVEEGELAAVVAGLRRAGIDPAPPPGWQPEGPQRRALVSGASAGPAD